MSTAQVSRDPPLEAAVELGVVDGVDEKRVVDGVERLTDVDRHKRRASRRLALIETDCDSRNDWEKSSGGGAVFGVAVLGGGLGKGGDKVGKNKTLEDFRGRAKKGDGAIGSREVGGFSGFGDGDNCGAFPDRGEFSVRDREVKQGSEER